MTGLLTVILSGCKVAVIVVEGGEVQSTGSGTCLAGDVCINEVTNTSYAETYTAVPDSGWEFVKWNSGDGFLCKDSTNPDCIVSNLGTAGNPLIEAVVASEQTYYVMPIFSKRKAVDVEFTLQGKVTSYSGFRSQFEVGQSFVLTSTYSGTITGVGRETLEIGAKGIPDPIFGGTDPGVVERPDGEQGTCSAPPDFQSVPCSFALDQMNSTGELIFQDGELVGVVIETDDEGRSEGDLTIIYPGFPSLDTNGMGVWNPGSLSPFPIIEE